MGRTLQKIRWACIAVPAALIFCFAASGQPSSNSAESMYEPRFLQTEGLTLNSSPGSTMAYRDGLAGISYQNNADHALNPHLPVENMAFSRQNADASPWLDSGHIDFREGIAKDAGRQDFGLVRFIVMLNTAFSRPVAEPAAMLIFGLGLAGVAGAVLRRKKAAK